MKDAGIVNGLREEFIIIGENSNDDSLILSLRSIQYDLAWERCRQLQAEDVVVKGKVCISMPISCSSIMTIRIHFMTRSIMSPHTQFRTDKNNIFCYSD